jgi:hypothetical protein
MRKMVEDVVYRYAPWTGIVPLYTMVSFGGMRYSEIRTKWVRQGRILQVSAWISALTVLLVSGYGAKKVLRSKVK